LLKKHDFRAFTDYGTESFASHLSDIYRLPSAILISYYVSPYLVLHSQDTKDVPLELRLEVLLPPTCEELRLF